MNILKKLDDLLEKIEYLILIATGTAIMAMILLNAACRYLRVNWFGAEELIMLVAFSLYFIGAACASRDKAHISADMITLFTKNRKIINSLYLIKDLISFAVCTVFTSWCFSYICWQINMGARTTIFKLPVIIATIPILFGFFMWCLYLIRDIIGDIKNLKASNDGKEVS